MIALILLLATCLVLISSSIIWFVEIIRIAISTTMSKKSKTVWILVILFVPPTVIVYTLTEKSLWWKAYGLFSIAIIAAFVVTHVDTIKAEIQKRRDTVVTSSVVAVSGKQTYTSQPDLIKHANASLNLLGTIKTEDASMNQNIANMAMNLAKIRQAILSRTIPETDATRLLDKMDNIAGDGKLTTDEAGDWALDDSRVMMNVPNQSF